MSERENPGPTTNSFWKIHVGKPATAEENGGAVRHDTVATRLEADKEALGATAGRHEGIGAAKVFTNEGTANGHLPCSSEVKTNRRMMIMH